MILPVKMPDDFKIPEGCEAVWGKPKANMQYIEDDNSIAVAECDFHSTRTICFAPKHTWPPSLKCAAISRTLAGYYVAHVEKPCKNASGEWFSNQGCCLNPAIFTDPLPALEVGECLFNPNFKGPT